MKILLAHNRYQQVGGEDAVLQAEKELLEHAGQEVIVYERHNDEIEGYVAWQKASLLSRTIWAQDSRRALGDLIQTHRPAVAHFHNTFPLISPAAYYACRDAGVPVIQTLHNYRLLCPNALFFRDGHVCEDCLGKQIPWPGFVHACYRGSRPASAAVVAMLAAHHLFGTWTQQVDTYIALTEFARQKFIEGGLPEDRIVVKPNFVQPDPGYDVGGGDYMLFVGRLAPEKGLAVLLDAWKCLDGKVPLKIVGEGPLAAEIAQASERLDGVEWLGSRTRDQVLALMKEAQALIFPSVWYEGFPVVVAEAFAVGLPVIAGNLGSLSSLIDPGRTGLHFLPGDPQDLARQVAWLHGRPLERARMRREARGEFEAKYTPERNYETLMHTYEAALSRRKTRAAPTK